MKHSIARGCIRGLFFGVLLAACLGFVAQAHMKKEPVFYRAVFSCGEAVSLYDQEGCLLQTVFPGADGIASSRPLPGGTYYAFARDHCTEFFLDQKPQIQGGSGWSDGKYLHPCRETCGTLLVEHPVQDPEFHTLCLTGKSVFCRKILRCQGRCHGLRCTFRELPFGTYLLFWDHHLAGTITLSPESPRVFRFLS